LIVAFVKAATSKQSGIQHSAALRHLAEFLKIDLTSNKKPMEGALRVADSKPKPPDKHTGWKSDQLDMLYSVYKLHPFTKSFFIFLLYTGARPQDMFGVEYDKLLQCLRNKTIYTPPNRKTSVQRYWLFAPEVAAPLIKCLEQYKSFVTNPVYVWGNAEVATQKRVLEMLQKHLSILLREDYKLNFAGCFHNFRHTRN